MGPAAPAGRSSHAPLLLALGRLFLTFLATLAGAVLVIQVLLHAAPGDPIDLVPNGEEMRAELEAEWGLDKPFLASYASFLGRALLGDLGHSLTFRPGAEVTGLILPAALRSLLILVPALILAMTVGLGLGVLTAGRSSGLRRSVQVFSVAPIFLISFFLIQAFNEGAYALMNLGLIERPTWFALPDTDSGLKTALAIVVLAVGSGCLAEVQSACEDEIVRLRNAPFMDALVARGAPLWPHFLLNLLPPLSTVASSRTAFLLGGLVIAEKVLHLNGVGSMLWQACGMRDYPVAMGIAILAAAMVCGARLLGDILRVVVDPRLREATP